MKVKDLISDLELLDPELEVLCITEDESLLPPSHGARILEIQSVSATDAEKRRGDDGVPSMKFGHSGLSQRHAFIYVTSDF
jgi:hypothetical protein